MDATSIGPAVRDVRTLNLERLHRTVGQVLGVPAALLSDAASPITIHTWDSLNHLNLVMALEGEFQVSLTAQDVLDMRNVGLVKTVLRDHGVLF
jgi:acyl carrier protein